MLHECVLETISQKNGLGTVFESNVDQTKQ